MLNTLLMQNRFARDLLDEVEEGARERYSYEQRAQLPRLRARLGTKTLDQAYFALVNQPGRGKKFSKSSEHEALRAAMASYLEAVPASYYARGLRAEYRAQMILVPRCISQKTLQELQVPELSLQRGDDLVLYAWRLARYNYFQTLGRLAAMRYLAAYAECRAGDKAQEAEFTQFVEVLNQEGQYFRATAMKFALVLQGQPLEQQRRDIAEESFSSEMSVVEYLHPLGRHPGRYSAKEESTFREQVANYLGTRSDGAA